jgi:CheY-like chemotaxis protein
MIEDSKIKVLLVDDEEDNLELYKEYLSDIYSYQVQTASSAKEAIDQ